MEIGISTASFFRKQYNEDALVTLNEMDSRVCEVFLETFCEYTPGYGELLKSRKGNLKVHSIHTLNTHFEPQLFSDNVRAYGDAVKIFRDTLYVAKLLGAHNYTMHGRARFKQNMKFDNYADIGKRFDELTKITGEYGVNLCIENVAWAFYNQVGFFGKIKDYAPDLKTCLDIKQAFDSGYTWQEYFAEMGDRLKTVHLSDRDESGKLCLPGKGIFDFETLFGILKDNGFDGNMLIEVYDENFKTVDELKRSLDYLRNIAARFDFR